MERGVNPIFPLPLFLDEAQDDEYTEVQKELTCAKNELKFNDIGSYMILNEDPFSTNFLIHKKCNNTINLINKTVDKFLKSLYGEYNTDGTVKWTIAESWMTKTNKGRCARVHSHGAADISGVYYLDTNGNDGNLILCNMHNQLQGNMLLCQIIEKGDIKLPLETGMIFLWPGQLKHYTLENQTDHERVSVSFNINLSRKGFDTLYS
tara:strand:- start:111 stop:731 length:621 start_codon:yes stop_codon:yes gene_type:complete